MIVDVELPTPLESLYYSNNNRNLLVHLTWKKGNTLNLLMDDIQPTDTVKYERPTGLLKTPDFAVENIYPNPASNEVELSFNVLREGNYQVELINNTGQLIKNENFILNVFDQNIKLNLDQVKDGLYLIKISNGKQMLVKKLMIAKY